MSAGLHRFLVSWVSLFFLSDTDFIRSVLARSGLHTVREDRRHRPDLHRSELSFTSPREQPDAQALLAGRISPLGQTPRSERRPPHPPGYAKFPRLPIHGVCAPGVPPALGLRPRGGSGRLCFFSRRAARRVPAFAETRRRK